MRVTMIRKPLQVAIVALSICPALVLGASAMVDRRDREVRMEDKLRAVEEKLGRGEET